MEVHLQQHVILDMHSSEALVHGILLLQPLKLLNALITEIHIGSIWMEQMLWVTA